MKVALATLLIVLVAAGLLSGCGAAASAPSPTAPPAPTATAEPAPTVPPPTSTAPPPTSTAQPPPTAEPEETSLEKHKFKFVSPLGTQEEGDRIESVLTGLPGIEEVSVTEISITVGYDPEVITLDDVRKAIESLGYKVEA